MTEHTDNKPARRQYRVEEYDSSAGRTIGVLGMGVIGFFHVCGGPFGVEVAVGAAGPFYTFLSFIVLPIIWAIPQGVMTVELSTMIPGNGGYVVWVREAYGRYGEFASWISGCCGVLASMFDVALYPTIFAAYFKVLVGDMTWLASYSLKFGLVLVCILWNIKGMSDVSRLSALMTVLVFLPFVVQLFMEFNSVRKGGNSWLQTPGEGDDVDWGLFTSTILWSYTGWDGLGCLAGEVKNPKRTYPWGFLLAIILVTAMYFLPLYVAIQTHPDWQEYHDGSLGVIAHDFAEWMGVWVDVVSMLSSLGLLMIALSASSRALWSMGDSSWTLELMPRIMSYESTSYGTPVASLWTHGIVASVLLLGDFELLIETEVILVAVNLLFEFGAFIWFRYYEPNRPRPRKVPGGWWGVAVVTTPKVSVLLFALATADGFSWLLAGGFLAVITMYYMCVASGVISRRRRQASSNPSYEKFVDDTPDDEVTSTPPEAIDVTYANNNDGGTDSFNI